MICFKKNLLLILGVLLMAVALDMFFEPFSLVTGGVTGLAIIARSLFGVPLWITNLVLNVPLFVLAYIRFDRHFVISSAFATALLSLFLMLLEALPAINGDYVTSVVFGGLIYGTGIGLVLKSGATTGGSDLAASLVNKLNPSFAVSSVMMAIDIAIILLGLVFFGTIRAMYGIIAVAFVTKAIDFVLEGLNFAKAAFIVCDNGNLLAKSIMNEVKRGVTIIDATGAYSGNRKNVLIVAVSRRQIVTLKTAVTKAEPSAFMFVTDIREVIGKF